MSKKRKNKFQKLISFIKYRIIGWCPYCQECHWLSIGIKKRRLNTAYVDEKRNWMTSCLPAFEETVDYYKERWEDYWSSVL